MNQELKNDVSIIPIGSKLDNDCYEIVEILGKGGFGIVYLVKDLNSYQLFAIKELFISTNGTCYRTRNNKVVAKNPKFFQKFKEKIKQEVELLTNIDNRNIIKVYRSFEENNTVYIVMEYLLGEDLGQKKEKFKQKEAIDLLKQLFHALKELHNRENPLIHRDIKPSNIIRIENTNIHKLIDFTNIKSFREEEEINITQIRTPNFAPPELKKTKAIVGGFSDIYSIGMTLYSLLSGIKAPPSDEDRRVNGKKLEIERLNIDKNFKKILTKMTEIKASDRYQSLEEIMKDIEEEDKKYSLKININPFDSNIRFLNSSKNYRYGMLLKNGVYHIKITKKWYEEKVKIITLNKNIKLNINLEKNIFFKLIDYIRFTIFNKSFSFKSFNYPSISFPIITNSFSKEKISISLIILTGIIMFFLIPSDSLCDTPTKMKICEERYMDIFEEDSTLINNFDEFKELVEAGVDIKNLRTDIPIGKNPKHKGGETALHHLAFKGKYDFVKLLIDKGGIDIINIQDFKGDTALYESIAYYNEHPNKSKKIIKLILDKNPDLSLRGKFYPEASVLSVAVALKLTYPIKELLNHEICKYERGRLYGKEDIYDILNRVKKGNEKKANIIYNLLKDNGC